MPFDIESAKLALQGIATLSGLVTATKAAIEVNKLLTEEEVESIKQSPPTISDAAAASFLTKIDQRILEPLVDNINDEIERIAEAARDKTLKKSDRQRITDDAASNICFELRQMKQCNGGVLPDVDGLDLYQLWLDHRCA